MEEPQVAATFSSLSSQKNSVYSSKSEKKLMHDGWSSGKDDLVLRSEEEEVPENMKDCAIKVTRANPTEYGRTFFTFSIL